MNFISINLFNRLLKYYFKSDRPNIEFYLSDVHGFSFPSGHSMNAMDFYGILIYLLVHSQLKTRYKYLLSMVCMIIILSVGLSRIYLGVHYASDVIGAYLITIVYLMMFFSVINKSNR